MKPYVFISWLDKKDDPFIRDFRLNVIRDEKGLPIKGPIHGVVMDSDSPYARKIQAGFVLATCSQKEKLVDDDTRERFRALKGLVETSEAPFPIKMETCPTDDPTDHRILFSFCLEIIGKARTEYPSAHLVINTSSGTPAMHTVWVLLSETRQIEGEYTLVQGVPPSKRSKKSPSSVSPIHIGIDSAFGRYRDVKLANPDWIKDVALDFSRAKSPLLRRLYADAKLYAAANIPLLILGERGSGKTELAKFIRSYYHAARAKKASEQWPTVNCGQFKGDPGSMRSELFGHVKGAYTGSVGERDGILKEVDGDVLFLDEIADLDQVSQRLLIRAIEEKKYSQVGSEKPITSDFRLVSATNRPLQDLRGSDLDSDFFDRISVLRLQVPPLRETPEDLNWMWDKMLVTTAKRAGIAHVEMDEKERSLIVRRLQQEMLPGNYRDLMRLASHVLLFLGNEERFASRKSAVEAAFEISMDGPVSAVEDRSRELARRYAEGLSTKDIFSTGIDVSDAISAYRFYLGEEITRHLSKKEVKDKTGVAYETANSWKR